ncbi:MAG: T9SS type A sorting domain-containing protein [Polaribacter sp.]|nr:T9SS type A sorting domain-containing protein [Polaribacter sp.]
MFSILNSKAIVSLFDVTGKEIYVSDVQLTTGKNEIDFNVKVKPGVLFLKVNSTQVNYGTSKIIFR